MLLFAFSSLLLPNKTFCLGKSAAGNEAWIDGFSSEHHIMLFKTFFSLWADAFVK
jgi:hypothetical protein